ncbi:MAG: hypothetical protein Q9218_001840 [Villophora microphyllina]
MDTDLEMPDDDQALTDIQISVETNLSLLQRLNSRQSPAEIGGAYDLASSRSPDNMSEALAKYIETGISLILSDKPNGPTEYRVVEEAKSQLLSHGLSPDELLGACQHTCDMATAYLLLVQETVVTTDGADFDESGSDQPDSDVSTDQDQEAQGKSRRGGVRQRASDHPEVHLGPSLAPLKKVRVRASLMPSTTQEQLESLFEDGFAEDNMLVKAFLEPTVPDDILMSKVGVVYDHQWMNLLNVHDDYLESFTTKLHVEALFRRQVLVKGDRLHFASINSLGLPIQTINAGGHHEQGRKGIYFTIDDPNNELELITEEHQRSVRGLVNAVSGRLHDQNFNPAWTDFYTSITMTRNGSKLGSLHDLKQRYALWDAIVQMWVLRTGQRELVRANPRTGAPSKLPLSLCKGRASKK